MLKLSGVARKVSLFLRTRARARARLENLSRVCLNTHARSLGLSRELALVSRVDVYSALVSHRRPSFRASRALPPATECP